MVPHLRGNNIVCDKFFYKYREDRVQGGINF